jgi:hypothetical protein
VIVASHARGRFLGQAYELAYATASAYCASATVGSVAEAGEVGAPTVFALDDVSFGRPVSIGDVLSFTAQVRRIPAGLRRRGSNNPLPPSLPLPLSMSLLYTPSLPPSLPPYLPTRPTRLLLL